MGRRFLSVRRRSAVQYSVGSPPSLPEPQKLILVVLVSGPPSVGESTRFTGPVDHTTRTSKPTLARIVFGYLDWLKACKWPVPDRCVSGLERFEFEHELTRSGIYVVPNCSCQGILDTAQVFLGFGRNG